MNFQFPMGRFFAVVICLMSLSLSTSPSAFAEKKIDFEKEIAPIFVDHCLQCHSPGINKGDVSLSSIDDLKKNEYFDIADPDSSHLIQLITSHDGQPAEMPKDGNKLSDVQNAKIRKWIAEGAVWPEEVILREKSKADASWWAYQPLKNSKPNENSNLPESWRTNPIDSFIFEKLSQKKLKPNDQANRRELIRRATYDLTGLPPTPEEVAEFEKSEDPQSYKKLIDRLLASQHYGERWGRHWLDVVRFGESNGFERNVIINSLWPFRDYVIQSINDDKPFDQFIREHIAGDVIGKDNPDVAIGSAFLVAGPYDDVGNQDAIQKAQIRANTLDEIINATGQAFLGMTLGCARCHDHKFDPIKQEDYYSFYATFSGIRHGAVPLATANAKADRAKKLAPLTKKKSELEKSVRKIKADVLKRAKSKLEDYASKWTRPAANRMGTEEKFKSIEAKFVRLICESQDMNPSTGSGFRIDEFEIWSSEKQSQNVALASNGGTATGRARKIEDFAGAYGPQHTIDGKAGERFIAIGNDLTIELKKPTFINRIVFSSAKDETTPDHRKFVFVADYRIEVSHDGKSWKEIANSQDRKPVCDTPSVPWDKSKPSRHLVHRLRKMEITTEEKREQNRLMKDIAIVDREIRKIPGIPSAWIGKRVEKDAEGPFHVFIGGSPQKKGATIVPASLSVLETQKTAPKYELDAKINESARRTQLAGWITHPDNPIAARVLVNRIWHYHFGTGIVNSPNDFGYMGGRPSHPELLDFLAIQLKENNWKIKALHRLIMTSQTYQQSSKYNKSAAQIDGDSRLLWRFPPRRLSAEEIRDTVLTVSGKLNTKMGGPGFRLYQFLQDNVSTYVPLDEFGPETYRRSVYHQNVRASVVDLMTDFDQPDCAFSSPKRAETTTPLQALTMLNHKFTLDMSKSLSERLINEAGNDSNTQIKRAYQILYTRDPTADEITSCKALIDEHGLKSLCRVLLNTSELIYVK